MYTKRFIMAGVCCAVIAAILMVCSIIEKTQLKQSEEQSASYSQKVSPLSSQKYELQTQLKQLEAQHEKDILGDSCVVLCVTQTQSNLYDVIYPFLKSYNASGVMIFKNNAVIDTAEQITKKQYTEMVNAGWETAMGGNDSIKLSDYKNDTEVLKTWKQYLDDYLAAFKKAGMSAPTVYYFNAGWSAVPKLELVNALRSRGFIGAIFPETDESILAETNSFDGFTVMGSKAIFETGSTVKTLFTNMNKGGVAAAISVRYIDEKVKDATVDCTTVRYKRMLDTIGVSFKGIKCKTFSNFINYRKQLAGNTTQNNKDYEAKKAELKQKISDLEDQINQMHVQ